MKEIFNNIYIDEEHPYLRPYLCDGNPYQADIFFVGTNPATPIYPTELSKEDYIKLFSNYRNFMEYYKKSRIKEGKTELSRTRMGISTFKDWVKKELDIRMIETDIFTYPTKNIKELSKVDSEILKRSLELFNQVLDEFNPSTIILHGSLTIKIFNKLMKEKNIKYNIASDKMAEIEKANPYSEIELNRKKIKVLGSKHFMYYGKTGNCFSSLKNNLQNIYGKER